MINGMGKLTLMSAMFGLLAAMATAADDEKFNYDEAQVRQYTLPDPLVTSDGRPVTTAAQWQRERRPELVNLFETQVYGRRLPTPTSTRFAVTESDWRGIGTKKQVVVSFADSQGKFPGFTITMYTPRNRRPAPAFVGMHLFDTKAAEPVPGKLLEADAGIPLPGKDLLAAILKRGYAIATLDAADFCPDDKAKFREGVLAHYYPGRSGPPGAEEPGAIATWAWGLSRALDYLEIDPDVDARRVAVIGHSRMGKTALWAGAEDPRFAIVISNDSGCGGAALSRRNFGESVGRITRVFPHWFCANFTGYANKEDQLPVDQHELVALIAPRPVYVASAVDDGWADPRGEFLAAVGAEPVYRLFGQSGPAPGEMPALNQSVGKTIGYHIRVGKHALTDFDWLKYLDFADGHWPRAQASPERGRGRRRSR